MYSSLIPEGDLRGTCLGGIPLEFPRFLTLKGTEQEAALQVQPHGFQAEGNYHFSLSHRLRSYQQNPISGLWYCLKGVCLFHDQVVFQPSPQTTTALLVSLQHVLLDGIIAFEEGFCILPLLYTTEKGFSKDFLNMIIFFLKVSCNILGLRQYCGVNWSYHLKKFRASISLFFLQL